MVLVWYPKCSTCQRAKAWLDEHGVAYTLRDIKEENPNAEELRAWHEKSGLPLQGGGTLGASCAAYKGDEYNDASGSPVRSSFSLPMFFAFSISDSLT
mgnify:FL=1